MDDQERDELARALVPVLKQAGAAVLAMRSKGLETKLKSDASPVTAADLEGEAIIRGALGHICPKIPIIGEESFVASGTTADETPTYFLVDPIDGTREFIAGRDDFAVNIAIVEQGFATLGIVYAPALGRLFVATRPGEALEERSVGRIRALRCDNAKRKRLIVLASRSHLDDPTRSLIAKLPPHTTRRLGSSLKFAFIAAGEADIYPRLAPTMAWDSAAGQALVESAGGVVLRPDGSRLGYSTTNGLRNEGLIVARSDTMAQQVTALLTPSPTGVSVL